MFIAECFFDIVIEFVDQFIEVQAIQKVVVDLIYELVQKQGDMNVLTLKIPGLFGRLRRSR
jgi:hypothetical protein